MSRKLLDRLDAIKGQHEQAREKNRCLVPSTSIGWYPPTGAKPTLIEMPNEVEWEKSSRHYECWGMLVRPIFDKLFAAGINPDDRRNRHIVEVEFVKANVPVEYIEYKRGHPIKDPRDLTKDLTPARKPTEISR